MNFFKAIKNISPDKEAKVKGLVSDKPLDPGYFGRFPASFSIHFGARTADKKKETFFLCVNGEQGLSPIYAINRFHAWTKHVMTLYSGQNSTMPPLAYVAIEKSFVGKLQLILPGMQAANGANQIVRSELRKSDWVFTFENEVYVWRNVSASSKDRDQPVPYQLTRIASDTGPEEVFGSWIAMPKPEEGGYLGEFSFQGPAAAGQVSPSFLLAMVVSVSQMATTAWLMRAAADHLVRSGGQLLMQAAGMGVGMGINAA